MLEITRHFFEADKPVAVLCHGPLILAAAGVLEDRTATAYPALQADVEGAGCAWTDEVTTDGNLVTGQAWPDHPEWIAAFLDVFGTEVEHDQTIVADD